MMYGWYGGNWGVIGWIVMASVMLLFLAGLVVLVVLLLRPRSVAQGDPALRPAHHEAERVLNERFARGEIDEVEFTARRAALRRA